MRQKRQKRFALAIFALAILLVLSACGGPHQITDASGNTITISHEEWLATADADYSNGQIQMAIGTFTPTATLTSTITNTPTQVFTPTPTPTATITPTPTAYYAMVANKNGQEVSRSLFSPDCSGEWGNPGVDVYYVEFGKAAEKVCSTPWNRFQNLLVKAGKYLFWLIGAIFVAGILYNVFGGKTKKVEKSAQKMLPMTQVTALAKTETNSHAMMRVVLADLRKEDSVLFSLVILNKYGIKSDDQNAWATFLMRLKNEGDPLVIDRFQKFVNKNIDQHGG